MESEDITTPSRVEVSSSSPWEETSSMGRVVVRVLLSPVEPAVIEAVRKDTGS